MAKISKKSVWQFAKYSAGGFVYFWSAWLVITYGEPVIGLWWANIIGNSIGIVLNYLIQQYWTFNSKNKSIFNAGWKFIVLTVVNLVLSYYILKGLVAIGVPLWLAQFVSAGFFTGWNWVWYRYWVFAQGEQKSK